VKKTQKKKKGIDSAIQKSAAHTKKVGFLLYSKKARNIIKMMS
jgi:hypothetical protein